MEVNEYFRILKTFPIFFFVKNIQNQNGKVVEEMLAGFKLDDVKAALNPCYFQNVLPPFASSFSPFLSHFVTWSREYCKWLNRLRRHIQIGRLSVQTPWAFWQAW